MNYDPSAYAKAGIRWGSVVYFAVLTLIALTAVPLYVRQQGLNHADLILFFSYSFVSILGITAGYHRLYAHRAYTAHRLIEFILLFVGAAAIQQSALKWAALHRQHHKYVDTERDPYNIKRGFFHAHIGWLLLWKYRVDYDGVKDLNKSALVNHQHRHFQTWALVSGVALPVAIGALYGSWLGGFLFGVVLRLNFVYHSTFFINSWAHTFGTNSYDPSISARDSWFCALLTNGEGYHSYHHRYPSDYRNGARWYHWDPSKWTIWILNKTGLVRNLNRGPSNAAQN